MVRPGSAKAVFVGSIPTRTSKTFSRRRRDFFYSGMRKTHIRDYRHVSWDWNGTLLDDTWLCLECLNEVAAGNGRPAIDLARYREIYDFPVSKVYEALGMPVDPATFKTNSIAYMAAYERRRRECKLHAGVETILESVKTAGIAQSIFSAYPQEFLEHVVADYGAKEFFEKLSGNDNIFSNDKAHRAEAHFSGLDAPFDEILYFGDTLHDAEIARELGIDCVLVAGGHQSRRRLEGAADALVAGDYGELFARL